MKRRGTSLIEILVVIVVFLVGILAIVQIFPGGFQILNRTRDNAMATQLGRDEIERLKGRASQMPDMIVPVEYIWSGSDFLLSANPNREPNDLGPVANSLNADGNLIDGDGNVLGNWSELTGANITRRVVGESTVVPAPRYLDPADPATFGSLMVLHFGPVLQNPNYQSLFTVFANDMFQRDSVPFRGLRSWEYALVYTDEDDESTAVIALPADRSGAFTFNYRMTVTATIQGAGGPETRTFIDVPIAVPADASGNYSVAVASLIPDFLSLEPASMRIARQYDRVASGSFSVDNPYQYALVNGTLGTVLINPAAYDVTIPQPGGRRAPLLARVSYDVLDWRIIREDFRVNDAIPFQQKLALQSIKVKGTAGADGRIYQGLPFSVPADGGDTTLDVVLLDLETGGVYLHSPTNPADPNPSGDVIGGTTDPTRSSYTVDKSAGRIQFNDFDRSAANGLQLRLVLPTGNVVTVDAVGRTVRALYMANNEWAVQAMKAPSAYSQAYGRPGIAQYYVGNSTAFGGIGTRIYFPPADLGRSITIDEVYGTRNGAPVGPLSFTGSIRRGGTDPLGLPYVDLSSIVDSLDYRYGQAVRGVKGASVAVRVLHNPQRFSLVNDQATNLRRLETWMQGWRRSTTETYLQRGDQ